MTGLASLFRGEILGLSFRSGVIGFGRLGLCQARLLDCGGIGKRLLLMYWRLLLRTLRLLLNRIRDRLDLLSGYSLLGHEVVLNLTLRERLLLHRLLGNRGVVQYIGRRRRRGSLGREIRVLGVGYELGRDVELDGRVLRRRSHQSVGLI